MGSLKKVSTGDRNGSCVTERRVLLKADEARLLGQKKLFHMILQSLILRGKKTGHGYTDKIFPDGSGQAMYPWPAFEMQRH